MGGWKNYIVLNPVDHSENWFVGWIAGDVAGISKIELAGQVRLLLGRTPVQFFGLDQSGRQIDIALAGRGEIGAAPENHRKIPLL